MSPKSKSISKIIALSTALVISSSMTPTALLPTASAQGYLSDNVHALNAGDVDVTPIGTETNKDGSVNYSFQISSNTLKSSDHAQTASLLHVAIPNFAKNVKFTQTGAFSRLSYTNKQGEVVGLPDHDIVGTKAVKVDYPIDVVRMDNGDQFDRYLGHVGDKGKLQKLEEIKAKYLEAHPDMRDEVEFERNSEFGVDAMNAPLWLIEASKEQGVTTSIPTIVDIGHNYEGFSIDTLSEEEDAQMRENNPDLPRVKAYLMNSNSILPQTVTVTFTVDAEQVKKTSDVAVWAGKAYRAFNEGGIPLEEEGG